MSALEFIVLSLATWRATRLIVEEAGPWDIFERFRYFVGVRYDDYSVRYGTNAVSKGIICVWCASVWVGLVVSAVYAINGTIAVAMFLPFALGLSATAIIVDVLIEKIGV